MKLFEVINTTWEICKQQSTNQFNVRSEWHWFVLCYLQILSGTSNNFSHTTVNPEYFVRTQFSYPGLFDLSYAWNFRTVADRCGFSDLLCTFRMHFIFVRKPPRTKYTKITCLRNILDLQYLFLFAIVFGNNVNVHGYECLYWCMHCHSLYCPCQVVGLGAPQTLRCVNGCFNCAEQRCVHRYRCHS